MLATELPEFVQLKNPVTYLAPLGFARAKPLPLIPLPEPRTKLPRPAPAPSVPPRLFAPDGTLGAGAAFVNLDADFEEGGFSTKDVSVVLVENRKLLRMDEWRAALT